MGNHQPPEAEAGVCGMFRLRTHHACPPVRGGGYRGTVLYRLCDSWVSFSPTQVPPPDPGIGGPGEKKITSRVEYGPR